MQEHGEQDTLAIFNKDAVCTYVSPSCEKVTGIPQDQYLGSNWFDWTHPDDQDYCREKYDVHLSQATSKMELSCRLINRAGVINHIHFAVSGYLEEEAGCSYYNPQLAPGTWTPESIPIEQRAKQLADCLLFVITADTRGVASMVEATELLSTGRSMVLVLTPYQQLEDLEPSSVGDDVNRGRKYLQELAARHRCPVLTDVREATVMAIDLVQAPKKTTGSPQPIDHTTLVEFALKLVREQQTNCTTAAAAPEIDPWESSEGE